MKIETKQVELRILRPSKKENHLTNGTSFSKEVYLGKEDSPENWREITEGEMGELTSAEPEKEDDGQ